MLDDAGTMTAETNAEPGALPERTEFAVIGAGFAGLGVGIDLKKQGKSDFLILEKAPQVGGTWRDNTYPGCACDVPSHLYSYSFATNADWSHVYAGQAEIWGYLRSMVGRYQLHHHLKTGCDVRRCVYDDDRRLWCLTLQDGRSLEARHVILATGFLRVPKTPDIPGLDSFKGTVFHTARWDHTAVLTGQRVACIGSGASAVQLVPEIVDSVGALTLFQRSPGWVIPRKDRAHSSFTKLLMRLPGMMALKRAFLYWRMELLGMALFKQGAILRIVEGMARRHLKAQVPDPALRQRLTPDYPLGCKRIIVSDDWYPALQRPNVTLIDSALARLDGNTLISADGRSVEVDALILSTGFDVEDYLEGLEVIGPGGHNLSQAWRQQPPMAHCGVMIADYPNFFLMMGPNTGIGHTSAIYMIEAQLRYLRRALGILRRSGKASLMVAPKALADFNAEIDEKMQSTVWVSGCTSWYRSDSGRIHTLYPDQTYRYRRACASVGDRDFITR